MTSSVRAREVGPLTGFASIACCVYPVVLVVLGLATAAEAVALGSDLFSEWGWALKSGGASLAMTGMIIQLRRGGCSIAGARNDVGSIGRVVAFGVAAYFVLYGATTLLADLACCGPRSGVR